MAIKNVTLGNNIVSGITTELILRKVNPGFKVKWIAWDSDFRRELQLNDVILQVNNENMAPLLKAGSGTGIGLYAEYQHWYDIRARDGQEITLSVLRQGNRVTVKGKLHAEYIYTDSKGGRTLAPGGPSLMERDGFSDAWSQWIEKYLVKMSTLMRLGWEPSGFDNKKELANQLAEKPRIDMLLQKYPGKFSQTLADDWNRLVKSLEGEIVPITEKDLEYRAIGEKRLKQAKEFAKKAWDAALKKYEDEMISPFPANDIMERADVIGKVVELPRITYNNMINDLGRVYAWVGSKNDGYYFLMLDDPEGLAYMDVMYRYKGQINPRFPEQYRYIGRINDDPRVYTVERKSVSGLTIKLLAVLAGNDELFVDLTEKTPVYAGEKELAQLPMANADMSTPAATIKTMIEAIKMGNDTTWRELIAHWKVMEGIDEHNLIDYSFTPSNASLESDWSNSRRLIMSTVVDARVNRVSPITRVIEKDAAAGISSVDEATVWIDHIGKLEKEKDYRVFTNVNVKRCWTVQRIDDGPWKIASMGHL
nr:hypothetical protein [Candidatus Sigynarchaeota archaeon]